MTRVAKAPSLALLFVAACATSEPSAPSVFDSSAGEVVVEFAGDEFVQCGGRRMALDAWILRMRQRLRGMDPAQRAAFVVQVRVQDGVLERATVLRAEAEMNRCVDELFVMGVRQIRFL